MIHLFTYFVYISLLFLVVSLTDIASLKQRTLNTSLEITQTNKLSFFHFVALILICFVVGFRYNVGVDWEGYKDFYEILISDKSMTFQDNSWEWGYFMINKLLANLNVGYTIMFFTIAIISWYFIFKSVPSMLLPLVIFFLFTDEFFFWSMNGVRQFVCLGIFIYSIKYLIRRNFKYYLLLIVFASLFHISILFVAPLYFIPFQKLYNQKFWFVAFIASFFFAKMPFLIDGVQSLYIYIAEKIPVLSVYQAYFSSGRYEAQELVVGLGYFFRLIITIIIILFSKPVIKKYPQTKIYFVLYFIGAIIFNLFYMVSLIGRINIYFLIMRPIVLAIIVFYLWENRKYRIVSIGLVSLYFILYLAAIYNSSNMCSPFQFVFLSL